MRENAKPIAGFPGYTVTFDGQIYSTKTRGRKRDIRLPLRQMLSGSGYRQLTLSAPGLGHGKIFLVHRIVAAAYHGPPPTSMHEVRHVDGDKENNSADNLAWATHVENEADKDRHGTRFIPRGEKCGMSKLTEDDVRSIRELYRRGTHTYKTLSAVYGVHRNHIGKIVRGLRWSHI